MGKWWEGEERGGGERASKNWASCPTHRPTRIIRSNWFLFFSFLLFLPAKAGGERKTRMREKESEESGQQRYKDEDEEAPPLTAQATSQKKE